MALNNTGNPVPSDKGLDLQDNAKSIDEITNSSNFSTTTRIGKTISTVKGMEAQYVFTAINNGVWAAGQTFTALNQYMVFSEIAYKPKNSTTLPYVVGATPVGDANVEVVGNASTAQIIDDTSQAYEFDTVALMKSSLIIFQIGKKLVTKGFTTIGDGLGTDYLVKTLAQAGTDFETIDEVDNHTLADAKVVVKASAGGTKGGIGSPNITNGYSGNSIAPGIVVRANTISGGGFFGTTQRIDGDETRYATIGGGYDNYINGVDSTTDIDGAASTISGGAHHIIKCTHATIGGGSFHLIGIASDYGTIAGGQDNDIADGSSNCTIAGGFTQRIAVASDTSTIGGGSSNSITGPKGTIGGGTGNTISSGSNNTINGGVNNTVSGGNAVVLAGSTNTASNQGAIAGGRDATASGRGSLAISSDDALGSQGLTNSEANSAYWRFRNGQKWLGGKLVTVPLSDDGGMQEIILETTATITASSSINFDDNLPANVQIIGIQLRVNTAVSNTMDVAYSGGSTQVIKTGFSFAQNTKENKWFDVNAATNITSATTEITITRNGGGSFTAGGEVYAQIRYKAFLLPNSV